MKIADKSKLHIVHIFLIFKLKFIHCLSVKRSFLKRKKSFLKMLLVKGNNIKYIH